jgi:hypothetical protein
VSDVPLVAGSVIGLRSWRLEAGELMPVSIQMAPPWEPGENESRCLGNFTPCAEPGCTLCRDWPVPDHAFHRDCTCGFYGVFYPSLIPTRHVFGVVEAYGRVVVGPKGFRAARARVLALVETAVGTPGAARLTSLDTVIDPKWRTVPWFPDMATAMAEFPVTDPTPYLTT